MLCPALEGLLLFVLLFFFGRSSVQIITVKGLVLMTGQLY